MRGAEGALLYERLRRARAEEARRWIEGQWSRWLGASELSASRFEWSEATGLTLSYTLKVTARLPARLSPSPQAWGRRFASLSARRSPLSLDPVEQRIELSVEGLRLDAPPVGLTADLGQGSAVGGVRAGFQRRSGGGRAEMSWSLSGGLLSPSAYPAWVTLARAVEAAEWVTVLEGVE